MIKKFLFTVLVVISLSGFGQTVVQPTTVNPENMSDMNGFIELDNPLYKLEIASFNLISKMIEFSGKTVVDAIPMLSSTSKEMVFAEGKMKLGIKISEIDPNKHDYKYIDPEAPFLVQIDGKAFWGTDGVLPTTGIASVSYEFGSVPNVIPASECNDLFEPVLCNSSAGEIDCNCRAFISKDRERVYLYMRNGSGTAAYEVTWVFEKGKYKRRVVDFIY